MPENRGCGCGCFLCQKIEDVDVVLDLVMIAAGLSFLYF